MRKRRASMGLELGRPVWLKGLVEPILSKNPSGRIID
jgi:hypothetical protein